MEINKNIENSINWLLNSGIRIKKGEDQGALYGWKDLTDSSYPFIYSEIVGYAITCFSWIYKEKSLNQALISAKESSSWIQNNVKSGLLNTGKLNENVDFNLKGDVSNLIYSFDNGMILSGLLNLQKISPDKGNLDAAIKIGDALVDKFFDGTKMIALLDSSFHHTNYGKGKWSTNSGSFQAKIAIGLLKLFETTGKSVYKDVACSLCEFALTKQNPDGRFKTNDDDEMLTYLHPHLYSCEGLLYAGINVSDIRFIESSLKSLEWAIKIMDQNKGSLPRSTKENIEQSDCIAQLLRLLIICYPKLNERGSYGLDSIIEKLQESLLNLYISEGEDMGGVKYQYYSNQACTWCTMFTLQGFDFVETMKTKNEYTMENIMEYYI